MTLAPAWLALSPASGPVSSRLATTACQDVSAASQSPRASAASARMRARSNAGRRPKRFSNCARPSGILRHEVQAGAALVGVHRAGLTEQVAKQLTRTIVCGARCPVSAIAPRQRATRLSRSRNLLGRCQPVPAVFMRHQAAAMPGETERMEKTLYGVQQLFCAGSVRRLSDQALQQQTDWPEGGTERDRVQMFLYGLPRSAIKPGGQCGPGCDRKLMPARCFRGRIGGKTW